MWTQGLHYCLLISFSSCLTVDHFPKTPVQDESLTLICSLNITPEEPVNWEKGNDFIRYSTDCSLDVNSIIGNDDDPTNYNVTCDIQPNIMYQYNLTIHRLEKEQHQVTWRCIYFFDKEQLNFTVLVRADKPVWTPGAWDYREGQLYNLTCSTNVADPVPSFSWWIVGPNNIKNELAGTSYGWQNETGIHNTIAFLPNRTLGVVDIWCKLNQSQFGELDSDRHTINVIYPPTQTSVRSSHEDLIVVDEQTETVIVSCQVSEENRGNPSIYNYTWALLRDWEIPGDDPTAQNLTLSVNRNNICLDNEYTCIAANILGEATSDAVNVTLIVAPELEQPIDTHYDVRYDNHSFALDCRYNAKPEARVLWEDFNDEVFEAIHLANQPNGDCNLMVHSSQRLQWRNNTSLDERKAGSGFVTCVADNGVGGGHRENVTINVQYPPVRTRGHRAVIFVIASMTPRQVTLSCVVDDIDKGNPDDYVFNWTRQHGDIPLDYNTSGNLTFTLHRQNIFFDDVYTCYVENTIGTGRPANVTLAVQVVPEYVGDGSFLATVLNTDDDISLPCQYIARPEANITWTGYRQDVFRITEQEEEGVAEGEDERELLTWSQRNLTWSTTDVQLRKHGSANVTCSGNNGVGEPGDRIGEINVQYGPGAPALRFTDDVVYAGGTATMTCYFTPGPDGTDGNPTVTEYTWLFGNDELVNNNSNHVTFAVISVNREGEYTCYGTNHPVGGSIRGDVSQPEYLTVNVSPYLVQPSEPSDDVIVLYNDQNTSLSCLGAGKPEVDFNWYHNEDPVDEEDFIEEKDVEAGKFLYDLQYGWRSYLMRAVGGAYFTCDNITKYDGHYQCEAYNDKQVSNMSAPVRLITHYPAHWAGSVPRPKRYTSPGDNFTLFCDVCMEPRGNITWYLNGEPVRDNVSITDDGRNLTLTDVQLEDFGNYTCQVTNIILNENYTESFDISLMERGAPHKPLEFQVDGSTSRSLNVSWLPGSTGGYDSQTFTLCYVTHHINQKCERISDPGGSDAIGKSLGDLKANTTYQLRLYAENAHHGDNRSSLTTINNSTKVAPVIKIVDFDLSATRVTVTWVVEAGEPSHLTLVHCPAEDCDVTTQRSRRYVKATWRELATNIPPDEESYTYEAEEDEQFNVYSHNRFNLWAYEPGLNERSNTDDDDAIRDVLPLSPGVDIGLVVGVVLAVVAAAALATSGFVYYRKKSTKGPSHREIGQDNFGMSPEGVGNPGYDDNDDIEPYGEVSFNVPPQSKPAASSSDPPSEVVEYAQEVKPKKKAKAAAEASAVYAMVDKTQKKTKTQGSVPEDETQDPYENVDFPKNKIEYLDKEPYYLSKDGLIYVNLLKKGPEVIHETAYEPSDYKTIDWVRTAQINKHPRPPTPPDTPPPRAEKYDDEEDIFGPLPFQAKEEEEQDGDFDEENVDYEDDGTRPTHATVTASMTQHSRREQVPEGAVGGVADHEMDSGHSSPRGQFFSST